MVAASDVFPTTGEQGSFDARPREQSPPQRKIERRRGVKEPPAHAIPSYWLVADRNLTGPALSDKRSISRPSPIGS
jgi:hypothetical protein